MKVTEKHENGASITVSGFNALKVLREWRAAQNAPEDKKEPVEKDVYGADSRVEKGYRTYDNFDGVTPYSPTVHGRLGFRPNEER